MTLLTTVIGRGTTGAKPAATDVPAGSLYYDTTLGMMQRSTGAAWENCDPAGAGVGDITFATVQASQLVNEIKGWPPCVNTGDLDALNLWWDKVGTPTTAPSVVAGNDGGITMQYNLVLKVVADGANEGLSQRWTYADESRVKAGRALSTLWAVWCVGGVGVTASLVNSDTTETDAAKVTAAAWTIVEVPNHTLAGTYCDVKLLSDGAGTFYAVPLGANIGARGFPLKPRGERHVDVSAENVYGADPGGAGYADLDLTAGTSALCTRVILHALYKNGTTAGQAIRARRNGSAQDDSAEELVRNGPASASVYYVGTRITFCDDGQVIEWRSEAGAGDSETLYLSVVSYWEWE